MKRKIIHVFHIENAPGSVIHALTTLEGLSSWWTNTVSGTTAVGGIIQFRFADVFKPDMKVVQSNESIIQWQCIAGEKEWERDIFSFELNNKGKNTLVTFTQEYSNEITDEQYGLFSFNWGYYLYSLKRYCETGTGTPWYNRLAS